MMRCLIVGLCLVGATFADDAGSGNSGLGLDGLDSIGDNQVLFATQYTPTGQVKRYETDGFSFPDLTGLIDANGTVLAEPYYNSFSFATGGTFDWKEVYADPYVKHIFTWRIIPTFVFGFVMLFICQIYNCCNCRSMHAEGDNDDSARCCKCCTPPDLAGKSSGCRTFFYVVLLGSAGIALFLGSYGMAESKRQAESGVQLKVQVDELAEWAKGASDEVLATADKAIGLFDAAKEAGDSVVCTDAVKGQLEGLMDEIGSFESFLSGGIDASTFSIPEGLTIPDGIAGMAGGVGGLTPEQIAAAEAAAAGAGGRNRARREGAEENNGGDVMQDATGELNSMVLSVEGQIKSIQNFTSDVVVKYEKEREKYVKYGLGAVIGLVLVTIFCGLAAACTKFMKHGFCACIMGGWSAIMITIMFVMFILSGILLLIITLWADFCADNFAALISVLSTKDFVYDTVVYYSYCPGYTDVQRAADFPFNEFVVPAKEALTLAGGTIETLTEAVTSIGDAGCSALVKDISDQYTSVFEDAFSSTPTAGADGTQYGLFTADGPIGCGALNAHLNMVMQLTCDDLYTPLSRGFEFFFVIGWLILLSELATKCLKVGQAKGIDDYLDDDYEDKDGKGIANTQM